MDEKEIRQNLLVKLNWPLTYNNTRKKMYVDYIIRRAKFLRMSPEDFLMYKEARKLLSQ